MYGGGGWYPFHPEGVTSGTHIPMDGVQIVELQLTLAQVNQTGLLT